MRPLGVALVWLCSVGFAGADESTDTMVQQARAHYIDGQALFQRSDYSGALREFEAGYELAPRPEFLLNIGQAHRRLHDTRASIAAFEKFLAVVAPDDPRRPAVEDVVRELRAEPIPPEPLRPAPLAAPVAPAVAVAVPVVAVAAAAPPRKWYRDGLAAALTGLGFAGIAVGAGLFASANSTIGDAGLDLSHFTQARDATAERTAGLTVLAIGGALVCGGIIRYALHAR